MANESRRQKHDGWAIKEHLGDIDDSLDAQDQQFRDLRGLLIKVAFTVASAVTGVLTALIQLKKG